MSDCVPRWLRGASTGETTRTEPTRAMRCVAGEKPGQESSVLPIKQHMLPRAAEMPLPLLWHLLRGLLQLPDALYDEAHVLCSLTR